MRSAALLAALALLGSAASAEASRLVRYEVGGGFAGSSDRLIVARDGAARQTDDRGNEKQFTVSARKLRALKAELKAARFGSLKSSYGPRGGTVADGIYQEVRYAGRTVSVETGGNPPARLVRLLRRLGGLLRR